MAIKYLNDFLVSPTAMSQLSAAATLCVPAARPGASLPFRGRSL